MTTIKNAWRVFAQGGAPKRSSDWIRHAERFFSVKIAFAGDAVDVAGVARRVEGRAREDGDLRDALAAPSAADNGLYDLAERRCGSIWLVEREGARDRTALTLAAIIASVCLGPILGEEIDDANASARWQLFGVRTAREKLLSLA